MEEEREDKPCKIRREKRDKSQVDRNLGGEEYGE